MLYLYQLENSNNRRRMIISDWEPHRMHRMINIWDDGFKIVAHCSLEGYFGWPVEIIR